MQRKQYQTQISVSEETANVLDTMKPRLKACVVARLSGLSQRVITQHAVNGNIPGAAKHGGLWTFDHDLVLQWVKEGSKCQPTTKNQEISTNPKTARIGGSESRSTASPIEDPLEQLLKVSRKKRRKTA